MTADRELRAETTIAASPGRVWSVLTDLRRMSEWSPETVAMVPMKPGGLRVKQWYLGINRRGRVFWPTRSVVSVFQPEMVLAWDTTSSGARWIFELSRAGTGTRLVQRRPVPKRLTLGSRIVAPLLLGGNESHADELEAGMRTTLERIRQAAEQTA